MSDTFNLNVLNFLNNAPDSLRPFIDECVKEIGDDFRNKFKKFCDNLPLNKKLEMATMPFPEITFMAMFLWSMNVNLVKSTCLNQSSIQPKDCFTVLKNTIVQSLDIINLDVAH